jgi:molybdenum cofactor cytidylyltransferase
MSVNAEIVRSRVGTVVLAAGLSRRFPGRNKLLADLAGRSILARTLGVVKSAGLGDVVVVSGQDDAAVRQVAEVARFRMAHNPDYEQGMGASIATGIQSLDRSMKAVFIVLGDMPFIAPETFSRLVEALSTADGDSLRRAAVPTFHGKRGNPVLFGAGLFPELAELTGDIGARSVCTAEPGREILVEVDDPAIHWDVDTQNDLDRANAHWKL